MGTFRKVRLVEYQTQRGAISDLCHTRSSVHLEECVHERWVEFSDRQESYRGK